MGIIKSTPLQKSVVEPENIEVAHSEHALPINEIQDRVSKMFAEIVEQDSTAQKSKSHYHKAKSKREASWLEVLEFIYSQHLCYTDTAAGSQSWEYREPMKSAVASLIPASKKDVITNPMLGLIKYCFQGCIQKNSQREWTRNNKSANVLYYAHRMRWNNISENLYKVGGRDKAAALGANLRRSDIGLEPKSLDNNAIYKKSIETFIAKCPSISASQLAAGDTTVVDGLSIAFLRRVEGEPAHLVLIPSACSVAANKAMARILAKVGGSYENV